MDTPALKIRRARRRDFAAVQRLLALGDLALTDRRILRRFRHIVADLGGDLYVAEAAGNVVGVIHATYVRQLGGAQRARIEELAVEPDHRSTGVDLLLLDFIVARARRRDCSTLSCVPVTEDGRSAAEAAGLCPQETEYRRPLAGEA